MARIRMLQIGSTTLWRGGPLSVGVATEWVAPDFPDFESTRLIIETADGHKLQHEVQAHVTSANFGWEVIETSTSEWEPGAYRIRVTTYDDEAEVPEELWVLDSELYGAIVDDELGEKFLESATLSPLGATNLMGLVLGEQWSGLTSTPSWPSDRVYGSQIRGSWESDKPTVSAGPTRWYAEKLGSLIDHVAVCGLRPYSNFFLDFDANEHRMTVDMNLELIAPMTAFLVAAITHDRFGPLSMLRNTDHRIKIDTSLNEGKQTATFHIDFPAD